MLSHDYNTCIFTGNYLWCHVNQNRLFMGKSLTTLLTLSNNIKRYLSYITFLSFSAVSVDFSTASLESTTIEWSDSDSDSDFYVVPIPDCFNPNLPMTNSTSTSVIVPRGRHCMINLYLIVIKKDF